MPLYDFKCPTCKATYEFYLPLDDYDKPQYCICESKMEKVVYAPQCIIKNYGQYNPGLGITIKDRYSVRDKIREIKDKEGRNVVEIGAVPVEKSYVEPYKPKPYTDNPKFREWYSNI